MTRFACTMVVGAALCLTPACSDGGSTARGDAGGDGGDTDGAVPDGGSLDLTFEATADPAERSDCPSGPPAAGEARAKHITCDSELLAGTVAMGRVDDDIVLENSLARFIVRGSGGSASFLGTGAGGLVDAAPQGGVDLIKDVLPLAELSAMQPTDVVVTDAGGARASVRVLFVTQVVGLLQAVVPILQATDVHGAIDYELAADEPVLHVTVHVTTVPGVGRETFTPGFGVLIGGAADMWQPDETGGRMVLEGPESATVLGLPAGGKLGAIQSINLLQWNETLGVARGSEASYALDVAVGATAADAWDAIAGFDPGTVPLTVTGAPGDRVQITRPDGTVVMRSRLDAAGEATVQLAPGGYEAAAGFGDFFPGAPVSTTVAAPSGAVDVGPAPSATLHVEATAGGEAGAPVRVTVEESGGGEVARLVAVGPTDFRLPPGSYRATLSRGPEFDIHAEDVTLTDGATTSVGPVDLPRVLDTTGWVAGDFHLHSEMSTDSRHWLVDALRIVAAEGLDVVAATDHDFVTDYERVAMQAGVDGWVLMVSGAEVSHPIIAHVNGYPLQWDPSKNANGAPPWFMAAPGEWFDMIRARGDTGLDPAGAIVQINHPRRSSSGLFESIDLDRDTGLATVSPVSLGLDATADLSDLSADAVEVWNKSPDGDDEASLLDYLALFSLGHRFAMMGNSDTHDSGRPAGSMRTFLKVPDDSRGNFTWQQVADAIRGREATVCGGIFVTASVASVNGDGTVDLSVDVQAPPWVNVERLRVYAGRNVVVDQALAAPGLQSLADVPLMGADFVMVRVDGGRGDPVLSHSTLGMTNPIMIP